MKQVLAYSDPAQLSDLEFVYERIISMVVALVAIVLFFLLTAGGISLLTSGGDPGKVAAAWKKITFAVLGFIFIIASYLILLLIEQVTGVRVTEFVINTQ